MSRTLCPYCEAILIGPEGGRKARHIAAEHPERAARSPLRHAGVLRAKLLQRRTATFAAYGTACLACGSRRWVTVDHVIPLAAGGTDDLSNWQPLCGGCNRTKAMNATDYRTVRA